MGKLYMVRHSITNFNTDVSDPTQKEKVRGWLEVPLSKDGIKKAHRTADDLKGKNIIKIYCSDLKRAVQTADIISKKVRAVVIKSHDLRCWNVGELAGMDGKKALPLLKQYTNETPDKPLPQGEAYHDFLKRWTIALDALIVSAKELPDDLALCAVVHSRNLYCLEHILSNGKHPIRFFGFVKPAGVLELDLNNYTLKKIIN